MRAEFPFHHPVARAPGWWNWAKGIAMRWIMLGCLLTLYAGFLLAILAVTYQDQTATQTTAYYANAGSNQVVADEEQSEPPVRDSSAEPPPPYDGRDAQYDPMDPALKRLLHCSTKYDRHRTSRFFSALKAVFHKNDVPLSDDEPGRGIDEGYAVQIGDGANRSIVVVLHGWDHTIPGYDTQYLFLLDADGKVLDRLYCSVNARLTQMFVEHQGRFHTELAQKPADDGAQLIVRYLPPRGEHLSGNWVHTVIYKGFVHSYPWDDDRAAEYEQKGLCRLAIREGKFARLFPN
jgi:hypothetical protein